MKYREKFKHNIPSIRGLCDNTVEVIYTAGGVAYACTKGGPGVPCGWSQFVPNVVEES